MNQLAVNERDDGNLSQHLAVSLVKALEKPPDTGCGPAADRAVPTDGLLARPRAPIDDLIENGAVRTLYQPIVHLESGGVVGFEALSRGPAGSQLESPLAMLYAAREVGRLGELDWLCRVNAMKDAAGAKLPASVSWFINVEPAGLRTDCPDHLSAVLRRARTHLRVILEVPEREVDVHVADLLSATDEVRRDSWGVALDDVGAEEGSLALLPLLQPDVVKLDMSLLHEVPVGASVEVVGAVHAYAERTGAVILAEGIETTEQERLACALGATYGQGYLYGRPASLPPRLPQPLHPVPLRQRPEPCAELSPFDVAASYISPKRSWATHLMPFLTHMLEHCGRATEAAVLLTIFDNEDHYRARADAYDQYSKGNAFTVCLVPGTDISRDEPRFHIASPPAESPLASDWGVIVLSPHFAAALLLRNVGVPTEGQSQLDYIFTHDRAAVVAAARAFINHMNNDRARRSAEPAIVSRPASAIKRFRRLVVLC